MNNYIEKGYLKDSKHCYLKSLIQQQIHQLEKTLKEWEESGKPSHSLKITLESQLRSLKALLIREI